MKSCRLVELLSKFEKIAGRLSKRESIPNIRLKIYMTKAASKGIFWGIGSTIAALNDSIETRCSNYTNVKIWSLQHS